MSPPSQITTLTSACVKMTQNMATIAGRQLRPAFIRRSPFQMSGWLIVTGQRPILPFSQPKLALQLLLSLVVEAMTKIHLKDPAKCIQRIIDTCKSL